jgi:predicted  nucleic acid-binding Zn-ribbon protein
VRALFDKISILEQDKAQLLDNIKTLEESVSDLTEAGRTLRDKYEERVAKLRQEVAKKRQLVIRQEGQLFLYLSVIEKQRLALRDAKIELPRDTKVEPHPQDAQGEQDHSN